MPSLLPHFVLSRCAIRREGKIEELPQNQPYLKNPQKQFAEAPRAPCITGARLSGASGLSPTGENAGGHIALLYWLALANNLR
jgi:hypothetical protein